VVDKELTTTLAAAGRYFKYQTIIRRNEHFSREGREKEEANKKLKVPRHQIAYPVQRERQ